MPKITYQEIRPGKWFKLVDGQVVAAATQAEVAAWRRENAAPANIWQDVLKTARPTPRRAEQRADSTAQESQQDSFWKDIVKPTKTRPRAQPRVAPAEDRLRGLRPRGKEDIDVAEQASIWRDVLNQSKKRVPPTPPPVTAPPAKAKEAEKPAPATVAESERAALTKVKGPEQPATPRAASKPTAASAPAKSEKPAKARPKARPPATEKKPAPAAPKVKPAGGLNTSAAGAAARPTPKPAPPGKQSKARLQPKTESASPPRRKPKAGAAAESGSPLYLWMVAGQSDDLLAIARAGLARYQQRFDRAAEVVLCHSEDLAALEGGKLPVDLREGKSLPRRNIWIGLK